MPGQSFQREQEGSTVLRALAGAAIVICGFGMAAACEAAPVAQGDLSMSAHFGEPEVLKFRDGKTGAFSMVFDDSMLSQADTAIPLVNARGLVGTFFVNPGTERYRQRKETWEEICPAFGHELANHTWRHEGAKDLEEADFEIGESSRHIWRLYPHRSKLLVFARGGGTTWGPSRDEIAEIMEKYLLVRRPRSTSISDEGGTAAEITTYPQRAIDEQTWVAVHFHGIGGEWISTNAQAFVTLLDFLVAHRDQLWIAGETAGYKYEQEYRAVKRIALSDPTDTAFAIFLECDPSKVATFGRPFTEVYDEPLSVRVRVPGSWRHFEVAQGTATHQGETIEIEGQRYVQFGMLPNADPAVVTRK
jgi:hypothetical protein